MYSHSVHVHILAFILFLYTFINCVDHLTEYLPDHLNQRRNVPELNEYWLTVLFVQDVSTSTLLMNMGLLNAGGLDTVIIKIIEEITKVLGNAGPPGWITLAFGAGVVVGVVATVAIIRATR